MHLILVSQLNASKNSATATKIATIDADGIITYNKADENAQALLNKSFRDHV